MYLKTEIFKAASWGSYIHISLATVRYGLVVRIAGSHPAGPGSIPGNGILFCQLSAVTCVTKHPLLVQKGLMNRVTSISLYQQKVWWFLRNAPVIRYWHPKGCAKKHPTRMGFEPTRAEPIGLAVQRLNHSATSSIGVCLSEGPPI